MRGVFRSFTAACLAALLLLAAPVWAAPDIMTVDQVKPGMTGIGKTVVAGTTVEDFNVEVLGIMKNKGPAGDLILVRVGGPLIDRTGGIAEGMSGSPVYIDGKLVGAIAYGWSQADHRIGMVTPIEDMLRLWQRPDTYNQPLASPEANGPQPLLTPVMAAGFGPQALARLAGQFKALHLPLVPYATGDMAADDSTVTPAALEPGSAVGVELMRGDLSLGALGTLTYREGDKILAFGHPFLQKGNTGYFLTTAYVFTTVNSIDSPFKVGTTGTLVGTVNQDRSAGIAGEVGRFPSVIPVRVHVTDRDLQAARDTDVQVVNDPVLAPALASTAAFSAMEKAMDRVGGGTARVSFTIMGRGLPDDLKRENMFYSPTNVADVAVTELGDALDLLLNNKFQPVDIIDVAVNIETSQERRTATIVSAQPDKETVRPGDTVNITVNLKPFRGAASKQVLPVTIPKDQPAGPLLIEIRGGGMMPLSDVLLAEQGLQDILNANKTEQSFDDVLKDFTTRDRNNDIVAELQSADQLGELYSTTLVPPVSVPTVKNEGEGKKTAKVPPTAGRKEKTGAKEEERKFHLTTDYIIEGDTQVSLTVQ